MDRLVGGAFPEVEGGSTRDVGCREGRARSVASRDDGCGGVNEADVRAGDIDGGVLGLEVPGVVAAVADEVLKFNPGVGVSERAALWLEDGSDAPVGRDDVEACEEAVVRESNDAFRSGERFSKTCVKRRGVGAVCFVKRDERSRRGDPSGCRGEARFSRAYERNRRPVLENRNASVVCRSRREELPERVREVPRTW